MDSLVSVIIPTYNRAEYLKLALKSVLEQTYKNIEVIVVDDGSTDKTSEVVANFNDSRVKYFYQKNTGLPAVPRNLGMQKASGEYIAFLDDDDMWLSEKLKLQIDYLRKHPEYYLVYSDVWIIDENGVRKELLSKTKSFSEGEVFVELTGDDFIPQLTVFMKREVFENIGFFNEDPTLRAVEDYEYLLRVALRYKIGFVKEPLAMYRVHPGGTINKMNAAKLRQKVLSSLLDDPLVPDTIKVEESIYDQCFRAADYYWQNSDKLAAMNELKKYFVWSIRYFKIRNITKNVIRMPYLFLKSRHLYFFSLFKEKGK